MNPSVGWKIHTAYLGQGKICENASIGFRGGRKTGAAIRVEKALALLRSYFPITFIEQCINPMDRISNTEKDPLHLQVGNRQKLYSWGETEIDCKPRPLEVSCREKAISFRRPSHRYHRHSICLVLRLNQDNKE